MLCGLLTTAACAVSPQFKAFLTHIFYSVAETFTSLTLRDPQVEDVAGMQGNTDQIYNGLRFERLPEGYEYVDGEETERSQWVEFENGQQGYIQVRVMGLTEASAYTYDSEDGEAKAVKVRNCEGKLVDEEGYTILFWVDEEQDKVMIVLATELPQEELLQLARALWY